jgi:4-carboxymuconolactone decarboxylase
MEIRKLLIILLAVVSCSFASSYAQNNENPNVSLTAKQQSIIPIAALTAKGELEQLKTALSTGLDAGLTVNEIKEILVHLYAYCGFPRSIRGLQTFMEVLEERKANSIIDEIGREATPVKSEISSYDRGKENLEKLTGTSQTGPQTGYAAFAPVIEIFLKEHLFAAIFERDVLTFAERQLVTISVLSSIGRVEPMLRSHLNICLNLGYTPEQLNQFTEIIKTKVGKKEAKTAQAVLDEVLSNR